ncbi:MAG: ABC transporter substrate-binding protein [Betaproteobacteria bacterium]|nr:ABC transporter substrate-binding protein [Betaproteobacteria bacterium]
MHTIGILETGTADAVREELWTLFRQRLGELGYREGRDIRFEFRWASGDAARLPQLAADLLGIKADVIVTAGTPASFAARRATTAIPIVMATGVSVPGESGESTARSAQNITGLSDLAPGLSRRRLELLNEVLPDAPRLAVLWDKTNPAGSLVAGEYQEAARILGLALDVNAVGAPGDFDSALSEMAHGGAAGFIGVTSAMFFGQRRRLAALALEKRLPAMFVRREYAEAGALMAYGASIKANYGRAADFVARILQGARPAELPMEGPTAFELVVNMTTARALGLAIPPSVLKRAQQVRG